MEKDIGKIKKNDTTDIVVRVDDFGGKPGVTVREFVTGDRYTGFTKQGTRIPADKFVDFREFINKIDLNDLKAPEGQESDSFEDSEKQPKDQQQLNQTDEDY